MPLNNFKMIAKTLPGLEQVLADELNNLLAEDVKPLNRAVEFHGDKALLYKSNLCLRTALRVLLPIAEFKFRNEKDLYKQINNIPWENYLQKGDTFAIDNSVYSTIFSNSHFAVLRTKDAIVDRLRNKHSERPNIDTDEPKYLINLRINENLCTISIDSSGRSLHIRGYKEKNVKAPLSEVLAAGMIKLTGWQWEQPLVDPMCGSGTIPIEAAMFATNTPANLYNQNFGFMRWNNFDEMLWKDVLDETKSHITDIELKIYASDITTQAFHVSAANIIASNMDENIKLSKKDFFEMKKPIDNALIIMNPPYDEKLEIEDAMEYYKKIGDKLKFNFPGCEAWVLSSNIEALKFVGLKPNKKIKLKNGPLDCQFNKYKLFKGTLKDFKSS